MPIDISMSNELIITIRGDKSIQQYCSVGEKIWAEHLRPGLKQNQYKFTEEDKESIEDLYHLLKPKNEKGKPQIDKQGEEISSIVENVDFEYSKKNFNRLHRHSKKQKVKKIVGRRK